jgi:putative DNA primase/helicase
MRQDFFDFRPRFKLMVAVNQLPRLRSADAAMRRRLHLVPFRARPELDQRLGEALRAEAGGIIAWALVGYHEWTRIGLQPPAAVTDEVAHYFGTGDLFAAWAGGHLELDGVDDHFMPTAAIALGYSTWARAHGAPALTDRAVGRQLEALGARPHRTTTARGWRVKLRVSPMTL